MTLQKCHLSATSKDCGGQLRGAPPSDPNSRDVHTRLTTTYILYHITDATPHTRARTHTQPQ